MKNIYWVWLLSAMVILLSSCGAYTNQPMNVKRARIGEDTYMTHKLKSLPEPKEPVYAAVYKFRDQTGQYRPSENGANWSTAVTQGATNILIRALENSKWFVPVERENVSNLLNERKIIRSSREQYAREGEKVGLPPLLFAGVILEGGIVSYDANLVTGGIGARYFGAGGSARYRQDRVSIYLRAISTQNGRILKTVYTSKTILSQSVDGGLFRFVSFQKLLEVETGFTYNEPSEMAVTEAIEKAVESMIVEGVMNGYWNAKTTKDSLSMVNTYNEEVAEMRNTDIFNRTVQNQRQKLNVQLRGLATNYIGDLANNSYGLGSSVGLGIELNKNTETVMEVGVSEISAGRTFNQKLSYLRLGLKYRLLPYDKFTPYLSGGVGLVANDPETYFNFSDERRADIFLGIGGEYLVKPRWGLDASIYHHTFMDDRIDQLEQGKYNDFYIRASLGVNFYFGKAKEKRTHVYQ